MIPRLLIPRLLIGGLAISPVLYTALGAATAARADDVSELAAIKAEMARLNARLEAIEARQAGKAGPRGVKGAHPAKLTAKEATRQAQQESAPERVTSIGRLEATGPEASAAMRGPAEERRGEVKEPLFRFAAPTAPGTAQGPARRIDLSGSSPVAITQTEVDRLPPVFNIGEVSVRLGGFVELSNIWRSANLTSGPATAWNNFPYANSSNHRVDEERLSAQLSRMSVLLEANPTKDIRLQAYVESDFGGSGTSSNSTQISGYTPRMRQGYFTFTEKDIGFHLLMGQAWSLVTNYAQGVLPRHEQLPAVTDNNQIPGIAFTRVPQIRIGKDWNQKYWLALSIEDPQATTGFSSSLSSGGTIPASWGHSKGAEVIYSNAGGVLLNSTTNYTENPVPDIVLKAAVDTSFGHYEVFGLARWFRDQVVAPGAATSHNHTKFGGGVGAGLTVPLGTQKLQLAGNILAGQGIGRYGAVQIPDVTFDGTGKPTPIPEIIGSLGLIGHPMPALLLYTYGGVETAEQRRYFGADGHQYGYGVTDLNLGGCDVEFGACAAQTKTLASLTTGGWWNVMSGHYGNVMAGLQYTYIRKFAFRGSNGAGESVYPQTFGHTLYLTFRYFPFQ